MNIPENENPSHDDLNDITGEKAFDGGDDVIGELKGDPNEGITRDTNAAKAQASKTEDHNNSGKSGAGLESIGGVE